MYVFMYLLPKRSFRSSGCLDRGLDSLAESKIVCEATGLFGLPWSASVSRSIPFSLFKHKLEVLPRQQPNLLFELC